MEAAKLSNMEIVRRVIEAADNNDTAKVSELFAATVVSHPMYDAYSPIKDEQVGYKFETTQEEFEQATSYELQQFPHSRTTIDEMFEVGDDKVVTITTLTSTHRSGKEITTKGIGIDRIADGKIIESWYSWDRLGYWQQLGFVPPTKELVAQLDKL
jgi:ketosteroid isomerase-like protein